ncbi:siderophore biosynthesis protein [Paracidovorax avenae]|nr:siderophore biosynthesis protein [Paracidovorax avenae]
MNTSDGQEAKDILDLIGIGIGPFNLGLAALLHPIDAVKARFFDTRDTFVWHEGLLLDNCYLQVPFMADLVTMVDPTSPFSFLNYLKEHGRLYQFYFYERFHIARTEYSRYCRWVAEQLCSLRFSMEVVDIEAQDSLFCVTVRNTATRALSRHLAKNIVLGVGTVPSTPDALSALLNGTDFIHSSQYAFAKPHLHAKRSITVIGGGQSAAECFLDLLEGQKQFGYELNWLTRGSGFLPMEYSKLGLEHFSPDYIEHFFGLHEAKRKEILSKQGHWYKGISFSTIAAIYDRMYERSADGAETGTVLQARSELLAASGTRNGWKLSFRHLDLQENFDLHTEAVVLGSGYRYVFPPCVDRLRPLLAFDGQGRPAVRRDYTLEARWNGSGRIFVQNAEMHTHGIAAPDLGLGAHRNAAIVNGLLGFPRYPTSHKTAFQTFGIEDRWKDKASSRQPTMAGTAS